MACAENIYRHALFYCAHFIAFPIWALLIEGVVALRKSIGTIFSVAFTHFSFIF